MVNVNESVKGAVIVTAVFLLLDWVAHIMKILPEISLLPDNYFVYKLIVSLIFLFLYFKFLTRWTSIPLKRLKKLLTVTKESQKLKALKAGPFINRLPMS